MEKANVEVRQKWEMEKANAVQVSTIKKRNYSTTWKRSRKNQHTTSLYNKATKTFPIHAAVR